MTKIYPSDLSDDEWKLIEYFFVCASDAPKQRGRKFYRNHPRDVVNAIFYKSKTGCQWRQLPQDFPPYSTVANAFYNWQKSGKWQKILDALRKKFRKAKGDKSNPTFAIMDSQSVKTAHGGTEIAFDGGKKVKGRKRQISVDKHGIPLTIRVKAANKADSKLGAQTINQLAHKFKKLKAVSADDGYKEQTKNAGKAHGIKVYIAKRIGDGFKVIPKRWIVERTFAWLNNFRILSKDYCRKTKHSVTEILIASIRIVMRKIIKIEN